MQTTTSSDPLRDLRYMKIEKQTDWKSTYIDSQISGLQSFIFKKSGAWNPTFYVHFLTRANRSKIMPGISMCKLFGNQPTSNTCSQDCRPSFSKIPGHGIQLYFEKRKMNGKMNFTQQTKEGNRPNRTSETKYI